MKKWEYKIEEYFEFYRADWCLNQAGKEGWELVGIYRDNSTKYAVFKRPVE